MSNPWIIHVANFRKKNPKLSYKEALIEAKKTYNQKGGNPAVAAAAAIAPAVAETVGVLGKTTDKVIDAVQTNKKESGAYGKSIVSKRANAYRKLKKRMEKGTFPKMDNDELWKYIDENII